MTRLVLSLAFLAVATLSLGAQAPAKPSLPSGWHTELAKARKEAAKQSEPLLIVFSTDWCGPCQQLLRDVYPKPEVERGLAGWTKVYVDGDAHPALLREYGVRTFPTFITEDGQGQRTHRKVGLSPTPKALLALLATASGKASSSEPTGAAPSGGGFDAITADDEATIAADDREQAAKALRGLAEGAWTMKASVKRKESDSDGGGMGFMVVGGRRGDLGGSYEGDLTLMRTAQGESLVYTKARLPGLAVFSGPKGSLQRSTAKPGGAIDAAELRHDLFPFMKPGKLADWAGKGAQWRSEDDVEKGHRILRTKCPKSLLNDVLALPAGDGMAVDGFGEDMVLDPMAEQILSADLELTLDREGGIVGISFAVTRSDPMATLMQHFEDQGGASSGAIDADDLADMDLVAGPTRLYRLQPSSAQAAARSAQLLKDFRELLSSK